MASRAYIIEFFLKIEFKKFAKQSIFEQYSIVLWKLARIPVTSWTRERSELTSVKYKLRSAMLQDSLNSLILLNIEREIVLKFQSRRYYR